MADSSTVEDTLLKAMMNKTPEVRESLVADLAEALAQREDQLLASTVTRNQLTTTSLSTADGEGSLSSFVMVDVEISCTEDVEDTGMPLSSVPETAPSEDIESELSWPDGDKYLLASERNLISWLNRRICTGNKWIVAMPCKSKGYLMKGSALCLLNRWEHARDVYTKGIDKCPKDFLALREALDNLDDLEEMIRLFSSEEVVSPQHFSASPNRLVRLMKRSESLEDELSIKPTPSRHTTITRSVSLQVPQGSRRSQPSRASGKGRRSQLAPQAGSYSTLRKLIRDISPASWKSKSFDKGNGSRDRSASPAVGR
ncbi:uncharacterized protein LOC135831038 isoform X1 [Sycon ciliatum]|uniref:uncharacterized protein LOC135831038 isoform X1 n=1 Tax=Sycon ciliatum TaxID=27933 RepID=UPI0031F708D8|eukprot:scpid49031/ scgid17050/ 